MVAAVCSELGLDATRQLAEAGETPAKDALRANTDEALKRGVFGAPTFFVQGRMFWGNDRLAIMEACLQDALSK